MKMLRFLLLGFALVCSLSTFAQRTIKGKIIDGGSDEPVVGATITDKLSKVTITTDATGSFKMTVSKDTKSVEIIANGFAKTEFLLGETDAVTISLKEQSGLSIVQTTNVIGSRNLNRSKNDAPVAVDIIPVAKVLSQTGHIELNQIMQYAVPSFNANRQTGADLADHVDPTSMRGMGPDQMLVLVNGKRMRPSSVINIFGVRGRGNAGYDLNTIPAAMVERIEVLRDGAAAQYGLDAVAGVINIVTKNNQTGTAANVSYGSNVTGWGSSLNYDKVGKIIPNSIDGALMNANVMHGFKIGKGNLTVVADYMSKGGTLRPNNTEAFEDSDYRSKAGDAAINATSLYVNGTYPLKKGELYLSGGFNKRFTKSNIWNIPFDDTTRNVYEIYNEPYFPILKTGMDNVLSTAGYKTNFGKWQFDISNSFGATDVETSTENTLNPSLGTKSTTAFFNSHQHYYQNALNMDFNRSFARLNLAFGAEYRREKYQTLRGDEASWKTYDNPEFELTDPATGNVYMATKVGTSQGFPGLRPEQEVNATRNNAGLYADAEYNLTKTVILAGAVRFENYSDFGSVYGGKLAARVRINNKLAMRGSVQTGFRAPSLTQVYFQSTINDVDATGNNFEKIVANNRSALAQKSQIPALKAEQSRNIGGGFVYTPNKNMQLSIDGYSINVKDRIVMSGVFFDDDNAIGAALKDLNVTAAQFFINALDTKTLGLDINASYKLDINKNTVIFTLAGNINKMEKGDVNVPTLLKGKEDKVLSPRELQMILAAAPNSKFHAMADYQFKKFSATVRLTYFSQIELIGTSGILGYDDTKDALYKSNRAAWMNLVGENYKPRVVPDIALNYDITPKVRMTVGGNNILDVYPTIQSSGSTDGGAMWDGVQMGMGGAYFFGKLSVKL